MHFLNLISAEHPIEYPIFLILFLAGGSQCFKRNSAEISVEFLELEYFLKFRSLDRLGWFFIFFKQVRLPNALRAFGWVSRNCDPLKGTRRLSRVDLLGRGVTKALLSPMLCEEGAPLAHGMSQS